MIIKEKIKKIIGIKAYNLLRKIRLNLAFIYKEIIYKNKINLYSISNYKFYVRGGTDDIVIINEVFGGDYNIHPKKKDIIIDIGGHIGSFSIKESKNVQKIYTFEPNTDNFDLLKKNIKINKINNIYISQKGISNQAGRKKLFMSPYSTGAYSIYESEPTRFQQIDCINLEEFIKREKIIPKVIKLDCEGAEYEILFNLSKSFFKDVKEIVMECHNISEGKNSLAMRNFLISMGYQVNTKENSFGHSYIYARLKND